MRIPLLDGWRLWRNAEGEGEPEEVRLPYDAMLGERRSPDAPTGSAGAYFPGGAYRYERELVVPIEWDGATLVLEFEGVYRNATVLLDGRELVFHANGYTGFTVPLPGRAATGEGHVVTVIADNSLQPNSRWYSGSGIYRPVWLHVLPEQHILPDGVAVQTLSLDPARVRVVTRSTCDGEAMVRITHKGREVAAGWGTDVVIDVPDARPWTASLPRLYEANVTLYHEGQPVDEATVRFGIRTVEAGEKGLLVNGCPVKLRGGCVHHDNGILGAADLPEASRRKVALLRRWGFNAIRSAHNPMSRSMLDACDELGMYVIDEFSDMWYDHKNPHDYASDFGDCWRDDLRSMVEKDACHPSVIMYSIGNENTEPATEVGVRTARALVDELHGLDPTRPVTAGVNLTILFATKLGVGVFNGDGEGGSNAGAGHGAKAATGDAVAPSGSLLFNTYVSKMGEVMNAIARIPQVGATAEPYLSSLDVCGYNYATGRYAHDLRAHPGRLVFGSETMCYDLARNWRAVEANPRLVGDFMWSAIDYLGEVSLAGWSDDPTPVNKPYPWVCADTGALDLVGNPNGEAAMAAVTWEAPLTVDGPMVFVRPPTLPRPHKAPWRGTNSVPCWTWTGCEGVRTCVEVYTQAPVVKLWQDGRHVWTRRTRDNHADFWVRYAPGELLAVACESDGTEIDRTTLSTAQGPLGLFLTHETLGVPRGETRAGDVAFVRVVLGRGGVPEGACDRDVTVEVSGGELLAFGSAAQASERSFLEGTYPTRHGLALAVVRVGEPGSCVVRARANDRLFAALRL